MNGETVVVVCMVNLKGETVGEVTTSINVEVVVDLVAYVIELLLKRDESVRDDNECVNVEKEVDLMV